MKNYKTRTRIITFHAFFICSRAAAGAAGGERGARQRGICSAPAVMQWKIYFATQPRAEQIVARKYLRVTIESKNQRADSAKAPSTCAIKS